MKITLSACIAGAMLASLSCDPALQAQTQQVGSTVTTTVILGTGRQSSIGFPGIGAPCTNYSVHFYDPTTNTQLACINTGVLSASTTGVIQTVNTGGTAGLPSSGTNTIPFVTSGGSTRPVTASDIQGLGLPYIVASQVPSLSPVQSVNGQTGAVTISGGGALPASVPVLSTTSAGVAQAATAAQIAAPFGCSAGQALGVGGACITPGSASIPASIPVVASNSGGTPVAATAAGIAGVFGCSAGQALGVNGTCVTPSGSANVPTGNTASIPATGSAGSLFYATDAVNQSALYQYNSAGSPVPLFVPGPSTGLTYNVANGQIDVNTSVLPRLQANNHLTGSNQLDGTTTLLNVNVTGTCTGCSSSGGFSNPMTTLGDLIAGGASGAAARLGVGSTGQVLTVSGGGQPAWQSPVAPPSIPEITDPVQNGGPSVTITTASSLPLDIKSTGSGATNVFYENTASSQIAGFYLDSNNVAFVDFTGYTGGPVNVIDYQKNNSSSGVPVAILTTGVEINTAGLTQPACSAAWRSTIWPIQASGTAADGLQVCVQVAGGGFAWKVIY